MAEFPLLVCSWIEQESRGGSIGVIELFRREVLERQGNRLLGEINLALPLGWQAPAYLLGAVALAGALFESTASYTRLATVPGRLIPEAGVAVILPSRAGVLREVYVREGSVVRQGQPLASVRVAEVLTSGGASS